MRSLYYSLLLFMLIFGAGCWNQKSSPAVTHYLLFAKQANVELQNEQSRLTLLTLKDVRTSVNFFASKPELKSGALSLRDFLQKWNVLHAFYRNVSFNSVIIFNEQDLEVKEILIEVVNLEWDAKEKVIRLILKGEFDFFQKAKKEFRDLTILIDMPDIGGKDEN
jgi:hypothetical protein